MGELFASGVFPVVLTLLAFRCGQWCQAAWKKPIFNPTLLGAVFVVLFLLVTGADVESYTAGAAKLSWLMTPATICLAIPMYEQLGLLRKNLTAVALGVAAGVVSCLGLLAAMGILLRLDRATLISLLPKSVTTAIGVPLSQLYGGMGAVTTAAIIVTGILGNMLGPVLCRVFRITDETAQGVAFGTAAHVIGTAKANELSPLTGAVSSLSLVVAGLMTAVLFPMVAGLL